MKDTLKILVLHPRNWAMDRAGWPPGVEVRHVSIGGKTPRRNSGIESWDGIGDVMISSGLEEIRTTLRDWRPHVFLFGIHMGLEEREMRILKGAGRDTRFVMQYTDQRPTISKFVRRYMGLLDLLLVTNQDQNDHQMYLKAQPKPYPLVQTFYDGVDPGEYWPKPTKIEAEVFFGGNNFWQLRKDLDERGRTDAPWINKFTGARFRDHFIMEVHKNFKLIIRGEVGWKPFVEAGCDVRKAKFHPHYLGALRSSHIILNTINVQRYGLITRRMFRALASGRLFVTEYCAGLDEHFANHQHMVWYKTMEEGLDVLSFYLKNSEARERIARQGREFVLKHHTFRHRLREFVSMVRRLWPWQ